MLPSSCQGSVRRLQVIRYILSRQGKVLRGTAPDVPIHFCWILRQGGCETARVAGACEAVQIIKRRGLHKQLAVELMGF